MRLLVPYLDAGDARAAASYAWQACAAIYSWYSTVPPQDTSGFTTPEVDREYLVDRAVVACGAHSIKFTEACLREYELNPSPVFLHAALDAVTRVGPA